MNIINSVQSFFDRLFAPILEKPERGLWLLMALQFIAWVVIPYLTFEQFTYHPVTHSVDVVNIFYYDKWGGLDDDIFYHGAWAGDLFAFNHPPLTILITHWANLGQGFLFFPHLVIAQIFICLSFYFVYRLGIELFNNKKQALAAVFPLVLIEFYRIWSADFNHNVSLMPFWAALLFLFYRATKPLTQHANQHVYWLWFGVTAGIATHMKLSVGILLFTMILWMLFDKNARAHFATKSPYLGSAIALLIMGIHYFSFFDGEGNLRLQFFHHLHASGEWVTEWGILSYLNGMKNLLYYLLVLMGALFVLSFFFPKKEALDKRRWHFILFFALTPIVLTITFATIIHQPIHMHWLFNMYNMMGIVGVALLYKRWRDMYLKVIVVVCSLFMIDDPIVKYPRQWGLFSYDRDFLSAVGHTADSLWREQHATPPHSVVVWEFDTSMMVAALLIPHKPLIGTALGHVAQLYEYEGIFFFRPDHIYPERKKNFQKNGEWHLVEDILAQAHYVEFDNKRDKNKPHIVGFVLLPIKQQQNEP